MGNAPAPGALEDEQRRADRLRGAVDVTCALLRQGGLTRDEGEAVVALARGHALSLFPGKGHVFDLVLAPRFARLLDEFCQPPSARVLPFPALGATTRGHDE